MLVGAKGALVVSSWLAWSPIRRDHDASPWVPIVVAILGLIGTAGGTLMGVFITQRHSFRRENIARQHERERERERERWAREDFNRTFEQRRAVYAKFYESLNEMAGMVLKYELASFAARDESDESKDNRDGRHTGWAGRVRYLVTCRHVRR
jgi:hypothetical protein